MSSRHSSPGVSGGGEVSSPSGSVEANHPESKSSRTIRAVRLSGEPLERQAASQELEALGTVRQLKEFLALADPLGPPAASVELLRVAGPDAADLVKLPDEAEISWEDLAVFSQDSQLRYIVRPPDICALLAEVQKWDRSTWSAVKIPDLSFPQILFHDSVSKHLRAIGRSVLCMSESARNDFWPVLRFAILKMPTEDANRIQADGMTVFLWMVKFYRTGIDYRYLVDLENLMLAFLDREDVEPEMLNSMIPSDLSTGAFVPALFLCRRDTSSTRCGSERVARKLLMVLGRPRRQPER